MTSRDAAREFARKLGTKSNIIVMGTVTDTEGLEDRSMVEVELARGSMVSAFAWLQADIRPGDDVVLAHVHTGDKPVYAVVAANSPSIGLDPEERDPVPDFVMWRGDPFRPPKIPRSNGATRVLERTQQVVRLNFQTYTEMRIRLRFTTGNAPNASQVEYWLWGYDPNSYTLGATPPFAVRIGDSWKNGNGTRWRTRWDLTSAGAPNEWLAERESALFVLALKRISGGTVRTSAAGQVQRLVVTFADSIQAGELVMNAESDMIVEAVDLDLTEVHLSATANMNLLRWWGDTQSDVSVRAIVMGA